MTEPTQAIKQLWQIIDTGPSSVLELRAIDPHKKQPPVTQHFRATAYDSVEACCAAFEAHALQLNGVGYNCYVVMNPINTEFRGRQFWFKFGSDQQVVYELNALAIDGLQS